MPGLKKLIALCFLMQLASNSAFAGSLSVVQNTASGSARTNKIGSLFSSDLLVLINGPTLSVQKSSDKTELATGTVFQTRNTENEVRGFCYFKSGKQLGDILGKDGGTPDLIETRRGEQLVCKIEALEADRIVFIADGSQKQIAMSDVSAVKSANVFAFSATLKPAGETDTLSFTPTCDRSLARKLQRQTLDLSQARPDGSGIPDRVVGFATGMLAFTATAGLVLPLAIAIPINRYREKMRNRRNSQQSEFLFRRFSQRQSPPVRRNNNNNP